MIFLANCICTFQTPASEFYHYKGHDFTLRCSLKISVEPKSTFTIRLRPFFICPKGIAFSEVTLKNEVMEEKKSRPLYKSRTHKLNWHRSIFSCTSRFYISRSKNSIIELSGRHVFLHFFKFVVFTESVYQRRLFKVFLVTGLTNVSKQHGMIARSVHPVKILTELTKQVQQSVVNTRSNVP